MAGNDDSFANQNAQLAAKLIIHSNLMGQISLLKKMLMFAAVLLVLLAITIAVLANKPQKTAKYFTVDPQGRITEVIALDRPTMSRASLGDWAADCVRSSYTFMFSNYKEDLTKSLQRCFTPGGMAAFKEQLNRSGILEQIAKGGGANITQVDGVVLIKKEGEIDGAKAYLMEIPVIITEKYPNKESPSRRWTVIVTAMRVDNLEYDKGMAIHVWNMERRN
jgi:hypothetical protein